MREAIWLRLADFAHWLYLYAVGRAAAHTDWSGGKSGDGKPWED